MLHLVGFPHTLLDDERFQTCAYTQKVAKFAHMGWGEELVVYHAGSSGGIVSCLTDERRNKMFGEPDPLEPPRWPTDEEWARFNRRAINEIRSRAYPGDMLLLAGGASQAEIGLAFPELTVCEPGVGYEGVWANFAAYESYAWQHHVYGKRGWDGRAYDAVIPNYFDPDEFPHVNAGDGDYLLFVGRLVRRKGPDVAAEIAKRCGMRLVVAGPGAVEWSADRIVAPEITIEGGDLEYVGTVGPAQRAELMAGAAAVLTPTQYVEPFCGVAVEAMMCGTPAIATDWGAFTETVENGVTGYRFRTPLEATRAVVAARELDPGQIRQRAMERFSLASVKPMFERWFERLETLHHGGYYAVEQPTDDVFSRA